MGNFASYLNGVVVNTATAASVYQAPVFVAGKLYVCDGPIDGVFKSKSFKEGVAYLCVKDGDQMFMVGESAGIVPVERLRSKFKPYVAVAAA